tara:strand:+ start:350 stop:532 length:183 start_codon:yes stop_codon:yes gene_type:complete
MEITKEKFEAFVEVQRSGMTNMFDVRAVSELSDEIISTDEVKEIMKQYASLMEKYPEVYN